jgi:uncharacterized protein YegP (UPF0339 family)
MKFVTYRDARKEYRWRLVAANGNIVADSGQGYKNKNDCLSTLESIRKMVAEAPVEDETQETA